MKDEKILKKMGVVIAIFAAGFIIGYLYENQPANNDLPSWLNSTEKFEPSRFSAFYYPDDLARPVAAINFWLQPEYGVNNKYFQREMISYAECVYLNGGIDNLRFPAFLTGKQYGNYVIEIKEDEQGDPTYPQVKVRLAEGAPEPEEWKKELFNERRKAQ